MAAAFLPQVHGASGGVGLAAVQLASAAGMRVIGTASSNAGRSAVTAAGAAVVLDHKKEGYLDEAVAATGGNGGFDVVVEMLANVNLPKARKTVPVEHTSVELRGCAG